MATKAGLLSGGRAPALGKKGGFTPGQKPEHRVPSVEAKWQKESPQRKAKEGPSRSLSICVQAGIHLPNHRHLLSDSGAGHEVTDVDRPPSVPQEENQPGRSWEAGMFSLPDLQLTTGKSVKPKRYGIVPSTHGRFFKSRITGTDRLPAPRCAR